MRATGENQFWVQADGGVLMLPSSDLSTGVYLPPGAGSWSTFSSREGKENVEPVEPESVLDRLESLDINEWNYRAQDDDTRHMGPMAEAFADAFALGEESDRISNVDADGVAFAAIQGLAARLEETGRSKHCETRTRRSVTG